MLLIILIGLVLYLIRAIRSADRGRVPIESAIGEKLVSFSENIKQSMDVTRQEVERSKDAVSNGTIKTLEHLKDMSKVIATLMQQQEKAQQLGQSLEYLLQSPKLRGSYGETILEEMLEKILPKGIWERQYVIDGVERVDAVVKYRDIVIPIDSKFPKEDYQKYLAAGDPREKRTHWANYERALKIQINQIKDKYVKPEKGTTEFALLFIPSEAIYYETIAEKNFLGDPCQIYEYATERKVIPVSPNTFYAFLHVIILGIRNIEIAKKTRELQKILTKMERDFGLFYKNFENAGKTLGRSIDAYKTADAQIQRFKRSLDSALKIESDHAEQEDILPDSRDEEKAIDGENLRGS
ncbi:MAG: DNA recombination protein RmuC [Candidatus Omnitrophota bacterium]